ncbi:rhodanese-like domain-containing protein [Pelovirga terrestris]|uniref:rhodanese-like domain-containing protein n=1 Tax=Pelovirga terrestris TaxID=2771352 RepID=UPI0030805498
MKLWILVVVVLTGAGVYVLMTSRSADYLELTAPEAQRLVAAGDVTLIDIRTPEEWRQTGVPRNAKLVNMVHPGGVDGFVSEILDQVDGDADAPIALICRTGNRTTQVQRLLVARGFGQVYNISEGMVGSSAGPGWLKRGLPIEPYPNQ